MDAPHGQERTRARVRDKPGSHARRAVTAQMFTVVQVRVRAMYEDDLHCYNYLRTESIAILRGAMSVVYKPTSSG